jgi:hypothetical protein
MRRWLANLLAPDLGEQDAAWRRAEDLLESSLTPTQYASYRSRGYLEVRSKAHPHRVYRVDGWRPVSVYDSGQFVGAVCIRPREHIPGPDVVLARKLMIEGAEEQFLEAGNWLQPAWRPAGVAPSFVLILALLSPWVAHLRELGPWGVLVGMIALALPVVIAIGRVRWIRRTTTSGALARRSAV